MDHSALYADPFYPSFFGTLGGALDAWAEEENRPSMEAWEAAARLQTALQLLTVGAEDQVVQLAQGAWETTAKLGADQELDAILDQLAVTEMHLEQPAAPPAHSEHYTAWHDAFLAGVAAACVAIDGPDDPANAVEPSYVPERATDSMVASVVYLSAWRVPGFRVGEEYVHWIVFGGAGQPPPTTGAVPPAARFPWVPRR